MNFGKVLSQRDDMYRKLENYLLERKQREQERDFQKRDSEFAKFFFCFLFISVVFCCCVLCALVHVYVVLFVVNNFQKYLCFNLIAAHWRRKPQLQAERVHPVEIIAHKPLISYKVQFFI